MATWLLPSRPSAAGAQVHWFPMRDGGLQEVAFVSDCRAPGVSFQWGGWSIRVVGGHAGAHGDRAPCQRGIDDIVFVAEHTPRSYIVILGAGTQQELGPQTGSR